MSASTFASLLIAIPGLLLVGVPLIMGSVLFCKLILFTYFIIKSVLKNVDYRFRPKLVRVPISDDEVKIRYHELDNREHGYNPLRQDFAPLELFRQKPVISQIRSDAEKLFPRADFKIIKGKDIYEEARLYFLKMLVERSVMIDRGQWDTEKEKSWVNFKGRPKQMLELDAYYMDWIYKQMGQESVLDKKLVS